MRSHNVAITVAVFGQRWAGDDAFGGLVADALRLLPLPGMRLLDLTESGPTGLLDHLEDCVGLIVVDAVFMEGVEAGELVDLDWSEVKELAIAHEMCCSTHGFSVTQQIELADGLGILPARVRFIGASLQGALVGTAITPATRLAVPRAVERVVGWMERWREDGP